MGSSDNRAARSILFKARHRQSRAIAHTDLPPVGVSRWCDAFFQNAHTKWRKTTDFIKVFMYIDQSRFLVAVSVMRCVRAMVRDRTRVVMVTVYCWLTLY